jgi:hypothetical protein
MSQHQGTLEDRYRIYVECERSLGTPESAILTFDEWLSL